MWISFDFTFQKITSDNPAPFTASNVRALPIIDRENRRGAKVSIYLFSCRPGWAGSSLSNCGVVRPAHTPKMGKRTFLFAGKTAQRITHFAATGHSTFYLRKQ